MFVQFIGFVTVLLELITFWQKDRNTILLCSVLSHLFSILYFFLLKCPSVSLMAILSVFRGLVYRDALKEKDKYNIIPLMFGMGYLMIILLLESKWYLIVISVISVEIYNYALWHQDISKMKKLAVWSSYIWFLYDIAVGAWMDILQELVAVLSIKFSQVREEKETK